MLRAGDELKISTPVARRLISVTHGLKEKIMIQDIAPSKFQNNYIAAEPEASSRVMLFAEEKLLAFYDVNKKSLRFPDACSRKISVLFIFLP